MLKKIVPLSIGILVLTTSCKDSELDQLMDEYCTCLDKNKMDQEGRFECIELMQSIKEKYKQDPRKLQKVIEKTNDCN